MKISILGYSGFIGLNLVKYLKNKHKLILINVREIGLENIEFESDIVINLIGKAHDTRNLIDANEYYKVNTDLCNLIYNKFLNSNAHTYIYISSIKAVCDHGYVDDSELIISSPSSHYGISKMLSENHIFNSTILDKKRFYILRPTLVHGPDNKGNLVLLYNYINCRLPWILGKFVNERSFCSIDNLLFVVNELIDRNDIPSGSYNVSDDEPLSTNKVIAILSESLGRNTLIWNVYPGFIKLIVKLGDFFNLPINSDRLFKLTSSFVVKNKKLVSALGKPLPVSAKDGLLKTFQSFK